MRSSTEQPSARSAFITPESTAGTGGPNFTCSSGDQPFGQASSATGMTSEALPPPATEAVLVTDAGAVFVVRTVILIGGDPRPPPRRTLRGPAGPPRGPPPPPTPVWPGPPVASLC